MNTNTIHFLKGGTGTNQVQTLTNIGVTDTVFSMGTDSGTPVAAVLSLTQSNAILGSRSPMDPAANPAKSFGSGRSYGAPIGVDRPYTTSLEFDGGTPFRVKVAGTFTSAVASNDLKVTLWLGSSLTTGSDTSLTAGLTTGAGGNFGAVSGSFQAWVLCSWDSVSGKLAGILENAFIAPSGIASTVIAPVAITSAAAAGVANLQFVVSAKFNASNAASTVTVKEFSIEKA